MIWNLNSKCSEVIGKINLGDCLWYRWDLMLSEQREALSVFWQTQADVQDRAKEVLGGGVWGGWRPPWQIDKPAQEFFSKWREGREDMKIKAQQDWDAGGRVRWEGQKCIYHVCLFGIIKEEKAGAKSQTSVEIGITSQHFISLCLLWNGQVCLVLREGKPQWQMPPMRAEGQRAELNQRQPYRECFSARTRRNVTQEGNQSLEV